MLAEANCWLRQIVGSGEVLAAVETAMTSPRMWCCVACVCVMVTHASVAHVSQVRYPVCVCVL